MGEEKLAVIAVSRETATDAEQRSSDLERDLQQAKTEIDRFSSSLEKKARDIESLQTKLDVCQTEQRARVDRKSVTDEGNIVQKNCESPCTISKNSANDLITSVDPKEDSDLRFGSEVLTKKIENLEASLSECQKRS